MKATPEDAALSPSAQPDTAPSNKGHERDPHLPRISDKDVKFRDASGIWGIASSITVGRIIRELETGAGTRTIMRIGLAGERLVRYASVITETYRHFGRLGLGTVFGSKRLKAITVSGNHSFEVSSRKQYRETYDDIYKRAVESPVIKKYHESARPRTSCPSTSRGAAHDEPQGTTSPEAEHISGENPAEKYLASCVAAPTDRSPHPHAALRESYNEPYFYRTTMIPYDYVLI